MGSYDVFKGKCPFCNADYVGQTKFFGCDTLTFEIGDFVSGIVDSMRLEMKERCIKCGNYPVAAIVDHHFEGFEKDNLTNREGYFGTLRQEGDKREDVYDEVINKIIEDSIEEENET